MNWLRVIILHLMDRFNRWLRKTNTITENIHISWADFLKGDKAQIVLYKTPGCDRCDEVQLFLKNRNIPYIEVNCKVYIPYRITNQSQLRGYMGFRAKSNKESKGLFLHPIFPQLDMVNTHGEWERVVGGLDEMKTAVQGFIDKHKSSFPGFELGVNQNRTPEEQVVVQLENIMREQSNG